MRYPSLSVLMPNYNHAQYLPTALDAILSQSYQPKEIIIIDDASTDNSIEILESYAAKYNIIRLIRNEKNLGVNINSNRLFEYATGDYVVGAAADDRVLPGFYEKSMNLLARYPNAGLCCSNSLTFDDDTGIVRENHFGVSEKPCYFLPEEVVKLLSKTKLDILSNTCVLKRTAVLEAGGYISELGVMSDWFLMHVVALRYGVCYIPECLQAFRLLPTSYGNVGLKEGSYLRNIVPQILDTVKSPAYKDVLPLFKKSKLLYRELPKVLFRHLQYWEFFNCKSLVHGILFPITPAFLKDIRRRLLKKWVVTQKWPIINGHAEVPIRYRMNHKILDETQDD